LLPEAHAVFRALASGSEISSTRCSRSRVNPTKEGFGAGGKWVWGPSTGAMTPRLTVDNEVLALGSMVGDAAAAGPEKPEDGPDNQ
jgi:hypothetical protein